MNTKNQLKFSTSKSNSNLAIAYLRVSTERQQELGNSIEVQKKNAEEYASNNNLLILDFINEATSASKIQETAYSDAEDNLAESFKDRPGLSRILEMAKQKKFKHLIVYSRDRLIRNFEMFIKLTYFFSKYDITIHYTKPGENILNSENNHISRFLELVIGNIAELEANLISERVKNGLKQKVINGYWAGGRSPYGYLLENVSDGKSKTLTPSFIESECVKKIFMYYNTCGYSFKKIAEELNKPYKTNVWTKSKVESIIKNETYTGKIVWNKRSRKKGKSTKLIKSAKNEDAEIITEGQWDTSIKLRNKKSRVKDSKYFSTPFLLRDFVVCSICNEPLLTKNYGRNIDNVYRCPTKSGSKSHLIIKQDILEDNFINNFITKLKKDYLANIWICYSRRVEEEKIINMKLIQEIDDEIQSKSSIKNRIDTLIYHNNDPSIKSDLIQEKGLLTEEINQLVNYKEQINNYEETYFKDESELNQALEKFFEIDFVNLSSSSKRIIIDTIVHEVIVTKKSSLDTDLGFDIVYKNSII